MRVEMTYDMESRQLQRTYGNSKQSRALEPLKTGDPGRPRRLHDNAMDPLP